MAETAFVVIIPAHCPADALSRYCRELCTRGISAVVVDDGSGAEFGGIFAKCLEFARVVHLKERSGRGHCLRRGMETAREAFGNCVIATLEADGRFGPDDVDKVLRIAAENPGKLILGSRKMVLEDSRHRRLEGAVTRATCRFATGARVRDPQSTLRAFAPELMDFMLDVPGERYEYEINALLRCTKKRVPILEVDIETNYLNGRRRDRLSAMRDFLRAYLNIVKFALSSFIGFVTDYFLYMFLLSVTGFMGAASVPFSNVAARVVSASVNYSINKLFIFKSSESVIKTAAQYFLLAGIILAGNTLLLTFLTDYVRMNKYAAKLITEFAFFSMSWLAQRYVIFRNKGKA